MLRGDTEIRTGESGSMSGSVYVITLGKVDQI
jgi:hypothetical protein